jgi:hypothetical protein
MSAVDVHIFPMQTFSWASEMTINIPFMESLLMLSLPSPSSILQLLVAISAHVYEYLYHKTFSYITLIWPQLFNKLDEDCLNSSRKGSYNAWTYLSY